MPKATDRSHDHYSEEVRELVKHFQDLYSMYLKTTGYNWKQDNSQRTDVVQNAWDRMARARKKETGSGFYVHPKTK